MSGTKRRKEIIQFEEEEEITSDDLITEWQKKSMILVEIAKAPTTIFEDYLDNPLYYRPIFHKYPGLVTSLVTLIAYKFWAYEISHCQFIQMLMYILMSIYTKDIAKFLLDSDLIHVIFIGVKSTFDRSVHHLPALVPGAKYVNDSMELWRSFFIHEASSFLRHGKKKLLKYVYDDEIKEEVKQIFLFFKEFQIGCAYPQCRIQMMFKAFMLCEYNKIHCGNPLCNRNYIKDNFGTEFSIKSRDEFERAWYSSDKDIVCVMEEADEIFANKRNVKKDDKWKRCKGCKVQIVCGRSCHKKAWNGGHRLNCNKMQIDEDTYTFL